MDLFVINRYRDTEEEKNILDRETLNLQLLKQKIEERKKGLALQKEPVEITLKEDVTEVLKSRSPSPVPLDVEENKTELLDRSSKKDKKSAEFKVLGTNEFQKKVVVKRILPHWLSHSNKISKNLHNLQCGIEKLDWLENSLKTTLLREGITHLFPVQEQVIPFILREHKFPSGFWPCDVCVSAPTGSGKTLTFVLPIVQILMNEVGHHIRALIVLPVQELAIQVAKVFKTYTSRMNLKVGLLCGSTPFAQEQKQISRFTDTLGWISEVDIVVCTAGRLVEHIQNTEGFSLRYLKFLVIDEADRIMDHIQNDWLYHLDKCINLENDLMTGKLQHLNWNLLNNQKVPPHKLLFSATLSHDPEKLEKWNLFQPKLFSAASIDILEDDDSKKYVIPEELKEQFIICNPEDKPLILYHLLVEQKWTKVLCFTNAAQSAHRLTILLNIWGKGNIKVAELSASLERSNRENVLKKFQQSEIDVLIGTDALARGIDIPQCSYVISYDPPRNIKTYVHRVGRTGRAGKIGSAITMLLGNQVNMFKSTLQLDEQKKLPQLDVPKDIFEKLSESYENAIEETKKVIHEEVSNKVKKSVNLKRKPKHNATKRKLDQGEGS